MTTRLASRAWPFALTLSFVAGTAAAQFAPQYPLPATTDMLVVDSAADGVWRLVDWNLDGDWDDPGEVVTFYDDVTGSIPLTNPDCIAIVPDGTAYVADSTVDQVIALRDRNGDGDANDPGEHVVWFDSATNASGVVMTSAQGMTAAQDGTIFVASSNSLASGNDAILMLRDSNGDGDANDAGEAVEYASIVTAATGDSIPTEVVIGPDGDVYYTDVGATGVRPKGVYHLHDANHDGDANDPGENTLFWQPTQPGSAFYWGLAVDRAGRFYLTDHGNEIVWRGEDSNHDGVITAGSAEETLYYQTNGSTWWDVMVRDDGSVLLCEDDAPDRITQLTDLDGDGDANDPGEAIDVYSSAVSAVAVKPRAATFQRGATLVAQPNPVRIGNPFRLDVTAAGAGDRALLYVAANPAALVLPPLGVLRLDPASATFVLGGVTGPMATLSWPLQLPRNPSLVGVFPFQAVTGDTFRLQLSTAASLQVTP